MEFYDVVKNRRSYRVYKPDMPEKDKKGFWMLLV